MHTTLCGPAVYALRVMLFTTCTHIDTYSFINLVIYNKLSKEELIYLVILGKVYKSI
jgi:hypothetical protein